MIGQSLTELSAAAAEGLSKCKGEFIFWDLSSLSDAAAESLVEERVANPLEASTPLVVLA